MADPAEKIRGTRRPATRAFPPGRIKIAEALKRLLAEKEFSAITTAEIARTAGVTEGLIYKYFEDKRDLLHKVLAEYVQHYLTRAERDMKGAEGALNKLRRLIRSHINMYATDRVFARILLLEVRNFPDYFKSEEYQIVRRYGKTLLKIIEEGVAAGEIRKDIPPSIVRRLILGGIEHACLPGLIFHLDIPTDALAQDLCEAIFTGIASRR